MQKGSRGCAVPKLLGGLGGALRSQYVQVLRVCSGRRYSYGASMVWLMSVGL